MIPVRERDAALERDSGVASSRARPAGDAAMRPEAVREQIVRFDCRGETLIGVLAAPDADTAARDTAVVIVVGGPQYRVGSHRQFVLLARALAAGGYPALRFDLRGMGDSTGVQTGFEQAPADIGAAIDALFQMRPGLRRVVLWGLCDGASAALLHLQETADPRVFGLVLLNPWVRSEATLARTHVKHYYLQRLRQREFWTKLLSGKIATRAAGELARNLGATLTTARRDADDGQTFQQRMASGATAFGGPIALMLSGNDFTAREFVEHASSDPAWRAVLARDTVTRIDFEAADHTFSGREAHMALQGATLAWLDRATARTAA